jgi:hypothetical protein
MKKLTTDEKVNLFLENESKLKHYKKRGRFIFREGIIGETVLTIVAGKLETMKTISEPSKVLRNIEVGSSAETYIISVETFTKRYDELRQSYLIDGITWGSANIRVNP